MRNWSTDVPGDILGLVLSKVFGQDRHAFSLVSKSWNEVASASPYRYSPCLINYLPVRHAWELYQYNGFFSLSIDPQLRKPKIHCSKHGWLLMSLHDDRTLMFFDPFNNRQVTLPCNVGRRYDTVCFFNPPTSPNCTVVGIGTDTLEKVVQFCVLKRGEREWKITERPTKTEFTMSGGAPVLHRGLVCFLDNKGNVATFDISKQRLFVHYKCLGRRGKKRDQKIKEHYLFKFNKGDEEEASLFAAFAYHDEREVRVFRLSDDDPKRPWEWERVELIGEKVVYLSNCASFGVPAAHTNNMAISNTIFSTKFRKGDDVAMVYSLVDKKYHSLNSSDNYSTNNNVFRLPIKDMGTWLMPSPKTSQPLDDADLEWINQFPHQK